MLINIENRMLDPPKEKESSTRIFQLGQKRLELTDPLTHPASDTESQVEEARVGLS